MDHQPKQLMDAFWSPDSHFIVFASQLDDKNAVFVADIQTGEIKTVVKGLDLDPILQWVP